MKKLFAILLSAAMLCTLFAVSASAVTVGGNDGDYTGGTSTGDVMITVDGAVTSVYSIDIVFTDIAFSVAAGTIWDPETYQYVPATQNGQVTVNQTAFVTITNRSNKAVDYTVTNAALNNTYGTVTMTTEDDTEATIAAVAVGATQGNSVTIEYTIAGTLTTLPETQNYKLTTISVEIEPTV